MEVAKSSVPSRVLREGQESDFHVSGSPQIEAWPLQQHNRHDGRPVSNVGQYQKGFPADKQGLQGCGEND